MPETVINCVGLIRSDEFIKKPVSMIEINAQFPHRLEKICNDFKARLIHISTDAVFDGRKGMYSETSENTCQ